MIPTFWRMPSMRRRAFTLSSRDSKCMSEAWRESAQARNRENASLTWVSPVLPKRFEKSEIFCMDPSISRLNSADMRTSPVIFSLGAIIALGGYGLVWLLWFDQGTRAGSSFLFGERCPEAAQLLGILFFLSTTAPSDTESQLLHTAKTRMSGPLYSLEYAVCLPLRPGHLPGILAIRLLK